MLLFSSFFLPPYLKSSLNFFSLCSFFFNFILLSENSVKCTKNKTSLNLSFEVKNILTKKKKKKKENAVLSSKNNKRKLKKKKNSNLNYLIAYIFLYKMNWLHQLNFCLFLYFWGWLSSNSYSQIGFLYSFLLWLLSHKSFVLWLISHKSFVLWLVSHKSFGPVGWDDRIYQLHLCKTPPTSVLDMTLDNLMVRLQQCWCFGECRILPYCHCSQVHSGDRVLSMGQIELNSMLILNWIVWNRTLLIFNCVNKWLMSNWIVSDT